MAIQSSTRIKLSNSPTQTQGSDVNTNIKGNNNHVTNAINQNQAANSGNGGNEGSGGGGDLPTRRILCSVIK